jgi:hypothetical protein
VKVSVDGFAEFIPSIHVRVAAERRLVVKIHDLGEHGWGKDI